MFYKGFNKEIATKQEYVQNANTSKTCNTIRLDHSRSVSVSGMRIVPNNASLETC